MEILKVLGTALLLHVPLALAILVGLVVARRLTPGSTVQRLSTWVVVSVFLTSLWLGSRPMLSETAPGALPVLAGALGIGLAAAVLAPQLAVEAGSALRWLTLAVAPAALLAIMSPLAAGWDRPAAPSAQGVARPDLLLITTDALSALHLSHLGYDRPTSPAHDRFAAEAVVFSHAVAASNFTAPTLASLITGVDPLRHRVWHLKAALPSAVADQSLPALLREAGYRTLAVSTNPFGGPLKLGLSKHFDEVAADRMPVAVGCLDGLARWLPLACPAADLGLVPYAFAVAERAKLAGLSPGAHYDPGIALRAATGLLRRYESDGRPIFLWVHLMPPHDPYVAPAPFVGTFDPDPGARSFSTSRMEPGHDAFGRVSGARQRLLRARYDEGILAVDHAIGEFLNAIRSSRRFRSMTVVLSADHGESFDPHYGGHGGPGLGEAVIRIPLLIRAPGVPPARVTRPVSQIDIAPTILALAGLPIPAAMQGRPLPLEPDEDPSGPARPVFSFWLELARVADGPTRGTAAVTDYPWKLVASFGDKAAEHTPQVALYNLTRPSPETEDLARVHPVIVNRLLVLLRDRLYEAGK